jgi:hypothetical protein
LNCSTLELIGGIHKHDYNSWPGVRKAVDGFFKDKLNRLCPSLIRDSRDVLFCSVNWVDPEEVVELGRPISDFKL